MEEKQKIEISKEEECIIFAKKKKTSGRDSKLTEEQKQEKGSRKNVGKAGKEKGKNIKERTREKNNQKGKN
jgi:hypothetical protein